MSTSADSVSPLHERALALTAGACSCLTKTPGIAYHDPNCLYRVLSECAEALHQKSIEAESRRFKRQLYVGVLSVGLLSCLVLILATNPKGLILAQMLIVAAIVSATLIKEGTTFKNSVNREGKA